MELCAQAWGCIIVPWAWLLSLKNCPGEGLVVQSAPWSASSLVVPVPFYPPSTLAPGGPSSFRDLVGDLETLIIPVSGMALSVAQMPATHWA